MALLPTDTLLEQEGDVVDCTICFNSCTPISLPCACSLPYCTQCWDRALAQSFQSCGEARCPTCRTAVHVDFDVDHSWLVFSRKDDEDEVTSLGRHEQLRMHQHRLAQQAKPVQLRLLREYGASSSSALELQQSGFGWEDAAEISAEDAFEISARCAKNVQVAPRCVCGMVLELVSGRERAIRCCRMMWPDVPQGSTLFESLVSKSEPYAYCDLCTQSVPHRSAVWTCQNDNRTILHANAFDICLQCFVSFAFGARGEAMVCVR